MIGSVIVGIGLALQVSGTLVISFDALGSQKETTDSITFLDHVVGLLKTRDEYVKQVDFQKEFDNSYATLGTARPGLEARRHAAVTGRAEVEDDLRILTEGRDQALESDATRLGELLTRIQNKAIQRRPWIKAAIVLVFIGGVAEVLGVHALGGA